MPQSLGQTIRNTFNKGLLTEFSELNFPNEASIDELNCDLFKAGNRTKRLGFSPESATEQPGPYASGKLFHTASWKNVGKDADLEYLIVQSGDRLRFFRWGAAPLVEQEVPTSDSDSTVFTINLGDYNIAGGLGAGASRIDVASVDGDLVITNPQTETLLVERDSSDGSFSVSIIDFRIRDFEWIGAKNAYDEISVNAPAGINRQYDTKNSGWSDGPNDVGDSALTTYTTAKSNYWPPLTHPWYSGKDSNGDFSVTEWEKVYSGTSIISNGHYILDPFNKDRETASGLTGIDTEVTVERFNCVAAYAGRVWYGGVGSRIYYSQILESNIQLGDCFSVNDPTSEETSDALATDGGTIDIPEANAVRKLLVFGSSLLVFADNGVWRVSGSDGNIFQATDFSVYKVTNNGLAFRSSLIAGQNAVPFWWSYVGIHTIQVTDEGGMVEVNISRDTIQTFWNSIGAEERAFVTGAYDSIQNRVLWLYPNPGETIEYKLSNVLQLDADLGAFFPWKVSDNSSSSTFICGTAFFSGSGNEDIDFTVVDDAGATVQDAAGNDVIITESASTSKSSNIYLLYRLTDGSDFKINFGKFDGTAYLDWGDQNYQAYAESAYNFLGDLGTRKNSPYITVFMKLTETGWVANGGGYDPVNETSLLVSTYWDFKNTVSSSAQEAYRHKIPIVVDTGDLTAFNSPYDVVVTRLKTRGRGRVLRVRFEGAQGKPFNLLGWETLGAKNSTY